MFLCPHLLGVALRSRLQFACASSLRQSSLELMTASSFQMAQVRVLTLRGEPDNDTKFKLYAFYKQATAGSCKPPKPKNLDCVGEGKWESWNQLADMEKSTAEAKYIQLADKLWHAEMNQDERPESHLLTSNKDGVFTMTMNRPGKKNGINFKMFREIILALDEATLDSSVRVAVWTGSGEWYSTGLDLTTLATLVNNPEGMDSWADKTMCNEFIHRLVSFPKPLVAAVNGPARGIATTSLALCDFVYASDKATFQTPFPELGVSAEGCSTYLFYRIMGPAKANEILMRGRTISAAEANSWGLISDVIPQGNFTEEVEKRVKHLSALPPQALQMTKKLSRAPLTEKLLETNKREMEGLSVTLEMEPMIQLASRFIRKK